MPFSAKQDGTRCGWLCTFGGEEGSTCLPGHGRGGAAWQILTLKKRQPLESESASCHLPRVLCLFAGGDVTAKNIWLAENILDMLMEQRYIYMRAHTYIWRIGPRTWGFARGQLLVFSRWNDGCSGNTLPAPASLSCVRVCVLVSTSIGPDLTYTALPSSLVCCSQKSRFWYSPLKLYKFLPISSLFLSPVFPHYEKQRIPRCLAASTHPGEPLPVFGNWMDPPCSESAEGSFLRSSVGTCQ